MNHRAIKPPLPTWEVLAPLYHAAKRRDRSGQLVLNTEGKPQMEYALTWRHVAWLRAPDAETALVRARKLGYGRPVIQRDPREAAETQAQAPDPDEGHRVAHRVWEEVTA